MNKEIINELCGILNKVDEKRFFGVVVALQSLGDTQSEQEVLKMLQDFSKDLQQTRNKELVLKDKNGMELYEDAIVYGIPKGSDYKHYFRISTNHLGEFQMLSCTFGYVSEVQPKHLKEYEYIGSYIGNEHLFECD